MLLLRRTRFCLDDIDIDPPTGARDGLGEVIKGGFKGRDILGAGDGVAGVGKTKLAADAPRPIFLQTEDGLGKLSADTFGMLRSYDDVQDALDVLYR